MLLKKQPQEEIVYIEQDNDEIEKQNEKPDEEPVQEEQVADSDDEDEDLLIPLSYFGKVWNLKDDTYIGTILKFSESTYKNGNPCWYTEIQVKDPEVIFCAKIPHELNAYQGLGMAVASLPKACVGNLIGKHISFAIENYKTPDRCFSNIIKSKLLKKK